MRDRITAREWITATSTHNKKQQSRIWRLRTGHPIVGVSSVAVNPNLVSVRRHYPVAHGPPLCYGLAEEA
jgi:hypothetical protein